MTKQLIIFIFSLLTVICYAQKTNSTNAIVIVDSSIIELKVILADDLNKIKLPPDCGVFVVNSMIFKYEVVNVIHGQYKANTVLINFRCPKQLVERKLIENGKPHVFKLRPRTNSQGTKFNSDRVEYEVIE